MSNAEQSTEDLVILELLGSTVLREGKPRRPSLDDGRTLVTVCAWCDRVRLANGWVETEDAIRRLRTYEDAAPPAFTHTICECCFENVRRRRSSIEGAAIA
ncbi:MAG TPA: hypothetical protein VHC67_03200 [Gaiellaceae bacterium]|jgi:hypothetical protein|nr:hypothetical protein [Gaiellaceae bacterium]